MISTLQNAGILLSGWHSQRRLGKIKMLDEILICDSDWSRRGLRRDETNQ